MSTRTIRKPSKKKAEILFVVEETPEGSFTAGALGFSIYTEADNWEGLKTAVLDAVKCHFDKSEKPQIIRLHYLRDEILAV